MSEEVRLKKGANKLSLHLTADQIELLMVLKKELLHWNQRINLSAITDPADVVEKHLLDSLTVVPYIKKGASVLDVGSGAGFPGLPLCIARPDISLASVESIGKKIQFQRHLVRSLKLTNVTTLQARIEQVGQQSVHQGVYDVAVSRAFSQLSTFVDLVAPMVSADGFIMAMKGREGPKEMKEAIPLLLERGFNTELLTELTLPFSAAHRSLIKITRI